MNSDVLCPFLSFFVFFSPIIKKCVCKRERKECSFLMCYNPRTSNTAIMGVTRCSWASMPHCPTSIKICDNVSLWKHNKPNALGQIFSDFSHIDLETSQQHHRNLHLLPKNCFPQIIAEGCRLFPVSCFTVSLLLSSWQAKEVFGARLNTSLLSISSTDCKQPLTKQSSDCWLHRELQTGGSLGLRD